jgi:hypothetical protein
MLAAGGVLPVVDGQRIKTPKDDYGKSYSVFQKWP